jgi:hypothetical protein
VLGLGLGLVLMLCALVLLALVPLNNAVPRKGIVLRPGSKTVAARKRCVLPALVIVNVVGGISGIRGSGVVMLAIFISVSFLRGPTCR